MRKLSSFYVIALAFFSFNACSSTIKIPPLKSDESCLDKLGGIWEGYVKGPNTGSWLGGDGRTLILSNNNGRLQGFFGAPSLGLLRINPKIQFVNYDKCDVLIEFMAAPGINGDKVELRFHGGRLLEGYFIIPSILPLAIDLYK